MFWNSTARCTNSSKTAPMDEPALRSVKITMRGGEPAHFVEHCSAGNEDISEASRQAASPSDTRGFVQEADARIRAPVDAGIPGVGTQGRDESLVVAIAPRLCYQRGLPWPERSRIGDDALVAGVRSYQEVGSRLITHDRTARRTSGDQA